MLNKLVLFVLIYLTLHLFTYLPGYNRFFQSLAFLFFNLVVAWQLSAVFVNNFYRKWFINSVNASDKVILVTGCDTGFGNLFAKYLNKKGYHVFASCISDQSLKLLKNEAEFPEKLFPFLMDITKDNQIDNCHQLIKDYLDKNSSTKFWALINNAGIARSGELEFGDFDQEYRSVFEVNTFASAKVTRKFLPLLRQHNKSSNSALNGRIININSLAGRCVISPTSTYSMSKHACVAFTEALRNEMYKFNIKVISVEPYYYETMQTNTERLISSMDNCWKNTDVKVKQDYGLQYDFKLKNMVIDKGFRKTVSRNANDVAKIVSEALSSFDPEDRYVCADLVMKIGTGILNFVPREFVDIFVRAFQFKFATDRVD